MTPPSPGRPAAASWTVVLPLKGGAGAKSRLGAPRAVARALALDSLAAVVAAADARRVLVVTPDPGLAREAAALGAEVLPESRPGAGLPAALEDGVAASSGPTAVLLGDLPALRPQDVTAALRAAWDALRAPREGGPGAGLPTMAFVPDAEGTGTVLLAAAEAGMLRPSFGPASADRHARAGAARLDLRLPRLRRDVDTPDDLATAAAMGLGPRTAAVLAWEIAPAI